MVNYTCSRCLKIFSQKSHYKRHLERKNICHDVKENMKVLSENNDKHLDNEFNNEFNNESKNDIDLLSEIFKKHSVAELALKLNLSKGTVNRWILLKNVPKHYEFDLLKLLDRKIDYSKYTSKEKDQFYTPIETARYCYTVFKKIIKEDEREYHYIEPSAGSGNFIKVLPVDRTVGLDIEPKYENIIEKDYLTWTPTKNKKYVVFGNPPFGLRGNLALRFINHSSKFAEYVCFILPQLFESDGKGSPRKRVEGLNLIHSEKIKSVFLEPDNNEIKINTIFQIWSKNHTNPTYKIKNKKNGNLKVYSLSDGGTPSSTRNKKMLDKCHIYLPSTCFGKSNMKYYESFDKLPGKKGYGIFFNTNVDENIKKAKNIKWCDVSFLSTNSAYNLRTSQINLALTI